MNSGYAQRSRAKAAGLMKVLFVLPNLHIGGVERVRLALVERFVASGIACIWGLRRCEGELLAQARSLAPIYEIAPRGVWQFVPGLVRLIRRERPTHVVTAFPDVALLTWMALQLAGSDAKLIHSVDRTHRGIATRKGAIGRVRSWVENRVSGFVYRHASAIVAVSRGLAREVEGLYHIEPKKLSVIHNPIVPDGRLCWHRKSGHARSDRPYRVVSVGRLVESKGLDALIRAMTKVDGEWCLEIWGTGPEQSALETLVSTCGMRQKIRFCGYADDPWSVMRTADIFVMSSRHEGLGNTLVEALACQCQVVSTDCPYGPREVLQGGDLGQLVEVGNEGALAEAISRVISGAWFVPPERLLDRARDFSWDRSSTRWITLLRSLWYQTVEASTEQNTF